MLIGDTLTAILAKIGGAPVGSTEPPLEGSVALYQDPTGVMVIPVCSSQGVTITQPAAGFAFTTPALAAALLLGASQVFPSRLFFANGSGAAVFGQVFNAAAAVAPGAVPTDVIVVPANSTAEIRYPGPTSRFDVGGFMAFSSTHLTFTGTAAIGLLGWDEFPAFI
jgi:hypothetical protein